MKPIGTITKYYQFINSDAQAKIERVLKVSNNFSDFVTQLLQTIIDKDENPHIKFLVIFWCELLRRHKELRQLSDLCWNDPYCRPYLALELVREAASVTIDDVVDSIKNALSLNPDDWIAIMLNIFNFSIMVEYFYETPLVEQAFSNVQTLLGNKRDLECFTPRFYIINSYRYREEGNSSSALEELEKGLRLARKFNDIEDIAHSHLEIASIYAAYYMLPESDREVRKHIEKAIEGFKELGDQRIIGKCLNTFGVYCGTRGEFDEGIDCLMESLEILENYEDPIFVIPHNISMMYCAIGNGKEALEWAKISFSTLLHENRGIEYGYLDLAWAYIILNQLDEASEHLDIAKKMVLKAGLEPALAWWYRVEGCLEKAKGNYDTAMTSLLSGYKIMERNKRRTRLIMCLCDLADTEVAQFEPTRENMNEEYSGHWLQKAEETMLKEDLPGFIAIIKIIKAKLRMKQGRHEEARTILTEISKLIENVGLEYLKPQLVSLQASFIRRTINN